MTTPVDETTRRAPHGARREEEQMVMPMPAEWSSGTTIPAKDLDGTRRFYEVSVTFIFYSYPVCTTVMALAAGQERFSWRLILPLALGIGGVSVIFSFSAGAGVVGPTLALTSAIAVAAYFVVAQVVAAGVPPAMSALWTSLGAGLLPDRAGGRPRPEPPASDRAVQLAGRSLRQNLGITGVAASAAGSWKAKSSPLRW
jgi:hypothetical protein